MARTKESKTTPPVQEPLVVDLEETEVTEAATEAATEAPSKEPPATVEDSQDIDDILNALKALLSTVEKLQKVRQEIGDIKPLLLRMLDGEVMSGDDLEQLKTGVGGLFRLVRAYSDHQAALTKAQPARDLLDQVLKGSQTSS